MGQSDDRDPKAAQELFDATVGKLLATPPRPKSAKKRPSKRKPAAKAKKR